MLELAKILRDIDNFGHEHADGFAGLEDQLTTARNMIREIDADPEGALRKIESSKTSWLTAMFSESPQKSFALPEVPRSHAVVAIDGSQIMADKHEVAMCYLINSAGITLFYGCGERPIAVTSPFLGYKNEHLVEIYGGKDVRVDENMVGVRRTIAEFNQMEGALHKVSEKGLPSVGLFDGSLILWTLQGEPGDYKQRVLSECMRSLDLAKERRIPVAGYVSDPGSRDFVNSLKILLCTAPSVDCDSCQYKNEPELRPCNAIELLKDSMVFGRKLRDGERSVLFTSSSKILNDYGEHRILAFYLNIGQEIVRIEIPAWVAESPELLALVHSVCYDQARKGRGYPVALSEAHERAVVRGADRTAFYEAIERSFVKHGAKITRSMKRLSKGY
ncbi:MAG TPA: DNA double-strand break repair nuclease NurA [Armatimonadota bacterium]|jgi:hypothetical protein